MTGAVGKDTHVKQESVPWTPELRHLLRTGRRTCGRLSQKAAAKRAGISPVYWQRIESGSMTAAPAGTLASMFLAAEITPQRAAETGHPGVAAAMTEILKARPEVSAEDYLAAVPGATDEEITALQTVWRALRAKRTMDVAEGSAFRNDRTRKTPGDGGNTTE